MSFPTLVALALFGTALSQGAEIVWTNTSGGNWSAGVNWNTGTAPGTNDHVFITNNATFAVTLDVNATVANLSLGGESGRQTLAASGRTFTVTDAGIINTSGVLNFANSTLAGSGVVTNRGTLNMDGGTIHVPLVNEGLLLCRKITAINGTLTTQTGSAFRVESENSSPATLTMSNGFINLGRIEMTSVPFSQPATLNVNNGTLVNAEAGEVRVLPGGVRNLNAQLDNRGLLTVNTHLTINVQDAAHTNSGTIQVNDGNLILYLSFVLGGKFDNSGVINIATNRIFDVEGGSFNYLGGSLNGPGSLLLFQARLNLLSSLSTGTVGLQLNRVTVNGPGTLTIPAGVTQTVNGSMIDALVVNAGTLAFNTTGSGVKTLMTERGSLLQVVGVVLTVTNAFTNRGTIELTGQGDSQLNVINATLVNATSGAIHALTGFGGNRFLNAQLNNQGLLTLNTTLVLSQSLADHTNSGTIQINKALLIVNSRQLKLTDTSALNFSIAEPSTSVPLSQLSMNGALRLGGVLNIGLTNGFLPTVGSTFRILQWNSHGGGFTQMNGLDLGGGLFFQAVCDHRGLTLNANSSIGNPPLTETNLVNQVVAIGSAATFCISPVGEEPFTFQWRFNEANLVDETNSCLTISGAQTNHAGEYCVVIVDAQNITNTSCATLAVLTPPSIVTQPQSRVVSPSANVTFSVTATGSPPLRYQWRLNGANIPGATNTTFMVTNAQPRDGGDYSVVVANQVGVADGAIANLRVVSTTLPFGDNFAARGAISGLSGVGSGVNTNATGEPGEPKHAGKPGGKSVWLQWTAPASGVASFESRGSAFDTLLAIYTGTNLTSLAETASDEDRGGFFTSAVAFNAQAGSNYVIALDGFHGTSGNLVLSWNLDTNLTELPRIILQPVSRTVSPGSDVTFSVFAVSSTNLSYQWFFNDCLAIAGATNDTLTVMEADALDVGFYTIEITSAAGGEIESLPAFLEIGPVADARSQDKLEDILSLSGGGGEVVDGAKVKSTSALTTSGFISVSAGTIDSQVLNNIGASRSPGEPNHCEVIGGASKWFGFKPTADAILQIDTIGSDIDTVLAVYTGNDVFSLDLVTCDNNGAPDRLRSLVRFPATANTEYSVALDGVNGAQGTISLNWHFGKAPVIIQERFIAVVRDAGSIILGAGTSSLTPDVSYQWRMNGQRIASATNATLAITNTSASYSVVVRNFAGTVTNTIIPIVLSYESITASGTFRLTGSGASAFVLEASTGLTIWTPLYTNAAANTPLDFIDEQTTNYPFRFYRARPWP